MGHDQGIGCAEAARREIDGAMKRSGRGRPNVGKEDMHRKVVVVGAGNVGSAFCYALAQSGVAEELVLIDANAELAMGQTMDLAHGQPYYPAVAIRAGNADA